LLLYGNFCRLDSVAVICDGEATDALIGPKRRSDIPMSRCPFCDHKNPPGVRRCASCKAELFASADDEAPNAGPESHTLEGRVRALLREGRKIEAIKLYRDLTGTGLKDAKEAVEAIERGGSRPEARSGSAGTESDVLELLRAGQKIQAIKVYRERMGVSLLEAKNAVELLATEQGIPPNRSGCAGAVLCALTAGLLLAYLMT
jgi:ribosomal protein L7/L12